MAELLNLQKRENAKVIPSRLLRWMRRVVLAAAGDAEIRSTGEGPDCGLGGGEAVGSAPYLLHSSGRGLKSREEVEAGVWSCRHCVTQVVRGSGSCLYGLGFSSRVGGNIKVADGRFHGPRIGWWPWLHLVHGLVHHGRTWIEVRCQPRGQGCIPLVTGREIT